MNEVKPMPKVYKDKISRHMVDFAKDFQELGKRPRKEVVTPKSSPEEGLPQAAPSDSRFEMVEKADTTKRYMRHKGGQIQIDLLMRRFIKTYGTSQ